MFEDNTIVYAITTHPGHHANRDNFGECCYLNTAALCARLMQKHQLENVKCVIGDDSHLVENYWQSGNKSSGSKTKKCRVEIIDVDYHCGNGTSSILYSDPSVFFTSIHCDPAIEYPFNQGYADQTGCDDGVGSNLHIPLAPGATWDETYKAALEKAMDAIEKFDVAGSVVSLGLDTYDGVSEFDSNHAKYNPNSPVLSLCHFTEYQDSVAVNRAGFKLSGNDYYEMGLVMGSFMKGRNIPTVFVQEGGYKMDTIGMAAANVVGGFAAGASEQ